MAVVYAVIETGGKQYKVKTGDVFSTEKMGLDEGSSVEFKVVAFCDEKGLQVGTPYLENAKVFGEVVENGKGKKITVLTYKPKKSCKRKQGHRQKYTKIKIGVMTSDFNQYA